MSTDKLLQKFATVASKQFDAKKLTNLRTQAENTKRALFDRSLEMANIVNEASLWFESDGKKLAKELDIKVTFQSFSTSVLGMQRSFAYKLIKVAGLIESVPEVVSEFVEIAEATRGTAKPVSMSIEELLKFAKKTAEQDACASDDEDLEDGASSESEGSDDAEDTTAQEAAQVIIDIKFVVADGKKRRFRVDSLGGISTDATPEELNNMDETVRRTLAIFEPTA